MISIEFIDYIASKLNIQQKELIEKDLLLQQLLHELIHDFHFQDNYVFKGGTCLIKCYLDYYRFSEDLDFTYANQSDFKNKSEKLIRKELSSKITIIAKLLETISQKLSLLFKLEKMNKKFIEYDGSNKFVTFKIWYLSAISRKEQFIKIQINFVELFKFPSKSCIVNSIINPLDKKEIDFLFPEYSFLVAKQIKINCYDLKEILIEKARAIITRQAIKTRDFVDIYFITKSINKELIEFKHHIAEKVVFMLKYEKYLKNIINNQQILNQYQLADTEIILLRQLPKDFIKESQKIISTAQSIINEIRTKV